jgi:hypothetical protein
LISPAKPIGLHILPPTQPFITIISAIAAACNQLPDSFGKKLLFFLGQIGFQVGSQVRNNQVDITQVFRKR